MPATSGLRRRSVFSIPVLLGIMALTAGASWKAEFRIHSNFLNDQTYPGIATDGSGRFLAVWSSERQDGELTGIFARLFDSFGAADGPEFQVNVNWAHLQEKPSITAGPNGHYLITWFDYGWQNIVFRLYDNTGSPLTGELPANEPFWGLKGGQNAAFDWNGGFVVVWHAHGYETGVCHVYARLFDRFGSPLGPQFRISRDHSGDQMNPVVAMLPDGQFTVVWTRFAAEGFGADIIGQRFNRFGVPLENEFPISGSDFVRNDQPRMTMDSGGGFMVCWHAYAYSENAYDILARRFSAAGFPLGEGFVVNSHRPGWQVFPSIASGDSGYLLTWQSFGQDGDGFGIYAAVLDRNGIPRTPEFQVNSISLGRQERPQGVYLSPGRIAVVWQDYQGESSGWDVYAAVSDISFENRTTGKPADRAKGFPRIIR
jgi:hypothetical protein